MGQVPAHQVDAHRECPGVRRSRVDVSTTRRKKLLDQPTSHFSLEPPPLRSLVLLGIDLSQHVWPA
jgi:hypothetical protein